MTAINRPKNLVLGFGPLLAVIGMADRNKVTIAAAKMNSCVPRILARGGAFRGKKNLRIFWDSLGIHHEMRDSERPTPREHSILKTRATLGRLDL